MELLSTYCVQGIELGSTPSVRRPFTDELKYACSVSFVSVEKRLHHYWLHWIKDLWQHPPGLEDDTETWGSITWHSHLHPWVRQLEHTPTVGKKAETQGWVEAKHSLRASSADHGGLRRAPFPCPLQLWLPLPSVETVHQPQHFREGHVPNQVHSISLEKTV